MAGPDFQDRSIMLESMIIFSQESVVFGARELPLGLYEKLDMLKVGRMFETVVSLFSDNAKA